MVWAAASTLALLVLRQFGASINWFIPLSALIAVIGGGVLRLALPAPQPQFGGRYSAMLIVIMLALVIWVLRMIQLDPSASLSSHHGWYPLYIEDSFQLGRFARIEDFAFGNGYLASIFFNLDLMGLSVLGKSLGVFSAWQAYSAASILAAILSIGVLAEGLARSRPALLAYAGLVLALLAFDFLYRTTLARNWGDALLFLPGAVMLVTMTREDDLRTRALWTAAAAIFMVVGRHYGAFYAGMIMLVGYGLVWSHQKRWDLTPWVVIGLLLVVLSVRDIACFLVPPSPYYPGSKLIDVAAPPKNLLLQGTLNDLGILTDGVLARFWVDWRNIYLLAGIGLIVFWLRNRYLGKAWLALGLAPFGLVLLPQLLQYLTLYRSSPPYSKAALISLHMFSWYPAYVLAHTRWSPPWRTGRCRAALTVLLVMAGVGGVVLVRQGQKAGLDFGKGPNAVLEAAFDRYRQHNVDLNIAERMRVELTPEQFDEVVDRPILYLHYEPGLALRNFIGGHLICDLDFWGPTVHQAMAEVSSLREVVARLGYPSIYFSFPDPGLYSRYYPEIWSRFATEVLGLHDADWIEHKIVYGKVVLLVPRRPADAAPPACAAFSTNHRP